MYEPGNRDWRSDTSNSSVPDAGVSSESKNRDLNQERDTEEKIKARALKAFGIAEKAVRGPFNIHGESDRIVNYYGLSIASLAAKIYDDLKNLEGDK